MNAKILFAVLLVAVAACCCVLADDPQMPQMPQLPQGMQLPKGMDMSKLQSEMQQMPKFDSSKMNQYFKDMWSKMTAQANSMKSAVPTAGQQQQQQLIRTRRQAAPSGVMAPLEPVAPVAPSPLPAADPISPVAPASPAPEAASPEQVALYEQSQETRLNMMMRSLANSPYMPTKDQIIQIATTAVTLMLMMLLGPSAGANSSLVQSIVKQVVPLVVAALFHYAADSATSQVKPPEAPITQVQLAPVSAPAASMGQTI